MPPSRLPLSATLLGAAVLGLLVMACASPPANTHYEFFVPPDPERDAWYFMVEDWQQRAQREEFANSRPMLSEPPRARKEDPAPRASSVEHDALGHEIGSYAESKRLLLAHQIADWALDEGRRHYRSDPDQTLEGDHWPTYGELVEQNGNDCDGLDLIAYRLLIEFGFPRDQIFRGVVRRHRDDANHMVTLWFEDPTDPWVFDGTGAISRELVRFSEITGWTPTHIFNEHEQYSVSVSGFGDIARAER